VVTDLVEIRKLAEGKRAEYRDFRRYLEAHHRPPAAFRIIAAEVERVIDCRECANCCREMTVEVDRAEVAAIASHLGTSSNEVLRLYTEPDPDGPALRLLKTGRDGCVFLDNKLCLIYEARPQACRDFPHASTAKRTLGGRMASVCEHATICPILFNALEEYEHYEGYQPAKRR
jgi:Fe-S-cluster containining protein